MIDCVVITVSRDRPDLVREQAVNLREFAGGVDYRHVVVEMGTDLSRTYHGIDALWYKDKPFRGKCFGHNVGCGYALLAYPDARYYMFIMNDVLFLNPWKPLLDTLDANADIGVLAPTQPRGGYPQCHPRPGSQYHVATTADYLCLTIPGSLVRYFGFLNPEFHYCWGAIHEYAHKMNKEGRVVAYCDAVQTKHLGGTTYGKVKSVCSRAEYTKRAKAFAHKYFLTTYGEDWAEEFTAALPVPVPEKFNTFKMHRHFWRS